MVHSRSCRILGFAWIRKESSPAHSRIAGESGECCAVVLFTLARRTGTCSHGRKGAVLIRGRVHSLWETGSTGEVGSHRHALYLTFRL